MTQKILTMKIIAMGICSSFQSAKKRKNRDRIEDVSKLESMLDHFFVVDWVIENSTEKLL